MLLHTLRTQLEYFIPLMSALDQDREILAPDLGCRWLPLDRLLPTFGHSSRDARVCPLGTHCATLIISEVLRVGRREEREAQG